MQGEVIITRRIKDKDELKSKFYDSKSGGDDRSSDQRSSNGGQKRNTQADSKR